MTHLEFEPLSLALKAALNLRLSVSSKRITAPIRKEWSSSFVGHRGQVLTAVGSVMIAIELEKSA